jgi:hypothetical protein
MIKHNLWLCASMLLSELHSLIDNVLTKCSWALAPNDVLLITEPGIHSSSCKRTDESQKILSNNVPRTKPVLKKTLHVLISKIKKHLHKQCCGIFVHAVLLCYISVISLGPSTVFQFCFFEKVSYILILHPSNMYPFHLYVFSKTTQPYSCYWRNVSAFVRLLKLM